MGSPPWPPESSHGLENLSDRELINLLPGKREAQGDAKGMQRELTPLQKQAIDELWSRHYSTVKSHLGARIRAPGSTLCPPQEPDKQHFLLMCLDEAYIAFLRRIVRDAYENLGGFLYTLAFKVALDLRRRLIGVRCSYDTGEEQPHAPVEVVHVDDETELLVDEGREPLQIVAARELRDVIRRVLIEYAEESPANALSERVVRYRHLDDLGWKEIAEKVFTVQVDVRSVGARVKKVRDKEKHDVPDLLRRLKELNVADSHAFEV